MKRKRKVHDYFIEERAKMFRKEYYIRLCPVDFKCAEFRIKEDYRKYTALNFTKLIFHNDGIISRYDKIDGRRDNRREGNDGVVLALRDYIDDGNWLKTRWKQRTETCRIRFWIKVEKIEDIIVPKNWLSHRIFCSTRKTKNDEWENHELTDLSKRSKYRSRLMSDLHWVYGLETKEIADIAQVHIDTVRAVCRKHKKDSLNMWCSLNKMKRNARKG